MDKGTPPWAPVIAAAFSAHKRGDYSQAEALYQRVLSMDPRQADALAHLGLLNLQFGRSEVAVLLIEKALKRSSKNAAYCSYLGDAYREIGKIDDARQAYQKALKLDPNLVPALGNLGLVLQDQGKLDEALAAFRGVLARNPDSVDALINIASVLQDKHDLSGAAQHYLRVLELDPTSPEAHFNLGGVFVAQGEYVSALPHFQRAVELVPERAESWYKLANTLSKLGNEEMALQAYNKAIALQPEHSEAYMSRGLVLQKMGELDAAKESLLQALHLRSEYPFADLNLGGIYLDMGLMEAALKHTHRGASALPGNSQAYSNFLLALNYTTQPMQQVFLDHLCFGERFAAPFRGTQRHWLNRVDAFRVVRIGYLSPDFCAHSVAHFLEPILASYGQPGFEVFCYADVEQGDAVTARLRNCAVVWRDIHSLNEQQVCELICKDEIDILVDLTGHTGNNRLNVFARKPAPVQVSYLGYPNTTGLAEIDYRITDAWADPEGMTDPFYSEKLIRLPHGFLCYRPDTDSPPVSPPPALALGYATFGCFNNLTKVTDEMIALWCRVLNAAPDSRFVFKARALADKTVRERIAKTFADQGVDLSRLDLLAYIPSTEGHLAAYHGIDIALDTFPYHGTTTTFEALWMGVPVVTLAGQVHAARVGVSILSRMGLSELIVNTPETYVHLAVELARDLPRLQRLRQTMRLCMEEQGLMDGERILRDLESAYREMWRFYCAKQSDVTA